MKQNNDGDLAVLSYVLWRGVPGRKLILVLPAKCFTAWALKVR